MSKHTPGPWKLEQDGVTVVQDCTAPRTKITRSLEIYMDKGERKANARLIASAPELLEAGEKLVAWLEKLADHSELQAQTCQFQSLKDAYIFDAKNYRASVKEMKAAISKAKGPK